MKKSKNILPIIMMIFLFGMISFVTNLASPMGEVLERQFDLSNFLGTLGVFANFIAYAVMGIPAGIILQKYGYKKTSMLAMIVGFTGVGIQTLSGTIDNQSAYYVYLSGAFVAGFSMCLLNTVVNPMLNTLGGGGNRGNQLIQVGGSFNSLCGTAVIMLVGVLVGDIAKAKIADIYPVMFIALAIFALAFIVIGLTKIPEPHKEEHRKAEKSGIGPLSFRHFVLGAIGIFVYVGIEVGTPQVLYSWLIDTKVTPDGSNLLGVSNDIASTIAGFVAGTYWFLMLIGRLTGVAVGSFVSPRKMLTVVTAIGLCLVLCAMIFDPANKVNMPVLMRDAHGAISFGVTIVPVNALFLVLVGLCMSVMWGGIFNLAVNGLGAHTEKASGIFMALCCGGGILPLIQNRIVDIISYQASYWVVFAGMTYLLFYALIGSRVRKTTL
jgi:FHS family L-fucose permease-like MFS transporter